MQDGHHASPPRRQPDREDDPQTRIGDLEAALAESAKRHRRLIENASDAILFEVDGRIVFANAAAVALMCAPNGAAVRGLAVKDVISLTVEPDGSVPAAGSAAVPNSCRISRLDGTLAEAACSCDDATWEGQPTIQITLREAEFVERGEVALRHTETVYKRLFEVFPDAIYIQSNDRIVFANPAAVRLFGCSRPEELIGSSALALYPPRDQEVIRKIRLALAAGSARATPQPPTHHRYRRRDGTEFDGQTVGTMLEWEGHPSVLAMIRDVTEARAAQARLQEGEARLRYLFDALPDAVFVHVDGRVVFANEAAARMFGRVRPEDLTGVETLDLYHPDVREEVRSRRAEIARLGYDPDGDRPVMHQFRRSDGSSFHADARVTTLPWEGRPAILVAFRDFSEQKKFEADLIAAKERAEAANRALAERERDLERASVELAGLNKSLETRVEERTRELRESQRTLTNLLATTPQGYWHVDNDGRTIDLNPAMCAILCRARDEVLGRTIYDFVVDANKAIFHTELEARKRGKQGVYEIALSRPDGSAISCLNNATPVFDDAGVKTGSIGLWTDVTEMKETERALVRAKEQAQAADVAKSRFLATMSHEIRTPLNGVLGMIGLLGRTRLDDRQRHFVKTVQSSAETLLTVINSILDYSRIEAGAFALDRVDFELPALVGEVVALFANAAAEKRLDLAYFFAPEVPSGVVGDPNRLRQVLVNLVGNAVKFTSQGRVVLRVRRGDAGALRFEVSDTGIGIAPEVRARLFAPFQQADASVTRKYGGTGLGLAISQNIVLTMGGLIEVESALDQGSTFRFDLVLPEATSVPVPRWRVVRQPWHERVLVVDANGSNREIVAGYGESWGLKVETADNGARAIELLRGAAKTGRPFDLAILDMTMTDMDSLDLARRIATEPAVSGVPMIMLTSIDWSVGRDGTREAGIVDVLTKPVNPAQLHDAIANALAKSHPDREVPAPDTPAQGAKLDADVLVAEDNPVNQEIVREYLELLGCRVTVVETGAEAVAAMAARRFDAVFMDCEMPELDGFEATRRARAAERAVDAERVLIVALIANALDGDRERCLAAGMDDYLGKPFSQEQIEVVLFRWIGKLQNAFAEPLDAATVASFAMRPGLFQRAALAYLAQVPNLVKWLREAVQRNSAEGVHFAALSLKSSSANIGANRLAELCARLEAEAKNGNIHGADPIVREIEDEIAAVRRGLESEMSAAALRTTAS